MSYSYYIFFVKLSLIPPPKKKKLLRRPPRYSLVRLKFTLNSSPTQFVCDLHLELPLKLSTNFVQV